MDHIGTEDLTLQLIGLSKHYRETVAVDNLSIDVPRGHVVAFLGPSGCGKTTTLRMIAGLATPTSGKIILNGKPIEHVPIHKRNIGMVFQKYALFPFLSVYDNIAYGLRERKANKSLISERVNAMLGLVGLSGYGARRIQQLSGGQQQRVALARALAINPDVLLLDEPLSNLDTKLRIRVRTEIRDLQRKLGITTILVTHDQSEALSIADIIVVMRDGRVEQIGSPLEIYQKPATSFIADFIGACNLLPAKISSKTDQMTMYRLSDCCSIKLAPTPLQPDADITLAIRPEDFIVKSAEDSNNTPRDDAIFGKIAGIEYLGSYTSYRVDIGGLMLRCDAQGSKSLLKQGTPVVLEWDPKSWITLK